MEKKQKMDMIKTSYISRLVEELNKLEVQHEDLVGIFPIKHSNGIEYMAIFYC